MRFSQFILICLWCFLKPKLLLCVISTVNLAGKIQGMPVMVVTSVAHEAAQKLRVLKGSDSACFKLSKGHLLSSFPCSGREHWLSKGRSSSSIGVWSGGR